MKKNIGIILKTHIPQKRVIYILDWELGKIKCVPHKESVVLGALVKYTITNKKPFYFLDAIEIIHIPFDTAIDDILFLHHIFELCHQFIPEESPNKEIFHLIKYLYFYSNMIESKINKKLFLFKLFILLGIYPEETKFQSPYFYNLATKSIDIIISKNLHLKNERGLDNWLHCCITTQTEFSNLKTINFLYKNRLP